MTRARNIAKLLSEQVSGDVNISGILTAAILFGEGSGITGVTAVGSGVTILDDGVSKGAASKIDFADYFTVSNISSGIATITVGITTENVNSSQINNSGITTTATLSVTGQSTLSNLNVGSGIATVSGQTDLTNLSVTGVSTFAGVTTSTSTLFANQLSVTGVSTFAGVTTSTSTLFANQLSVTGVSTFAGVTTVTSNTFFAKAINVSGISTISELDVLNDVTAFKRVEVAGVSTMSNGGYSTLGIVTASSFVGDGSQLTGISVGSTADIRTSSLVVSGVSTFTGNVSVGSSFTYTSGNAAIFTAPARPSLSIYQSTSTNEAFLEYAGTDLNIRSYGSTYIWSDVDGSAGFPLVADSSGSAQLYFGTNKKLETLGAGVTITGTTFTNQLNVSGVTTLGTVQVSSGIITASSGIVTYYGDTSNAIDGRWVLGANGTSDYTFTGIGFTQTTNDPILYLARGRVYEFVNNSGGAHPFQIRVSDGGAAYDNGVTNNGAATGTIRFEVPFNASNTLYYQCTNHSGMGNTITIYPTI
jgi:hypothetical protein